VSPASARRPLIAALAGAMGISFSGILVKAAAVSPATAAVFRTGYAIPLLAWLWWRRKGQDARPPGARRLGLLAGLFLAGDLLAWHAAIGYIGAGLATLLANLQVVLVAVLAWLILRERPSNRIFVAVPVVLTGAVLVSGLGRSDSYGTRPLLGTVLGLTTALFYAGFLLIFRQSNPDRASAAGPLLEVCVASTVASSVAGMIGGSVDFVPSWPAHGWLLLLAWGAQVGSWLAIGYALPRLPAAETATLILIQPVLAMVWGAIIFSERPSVYQLAGAGLVLVGVAVVASRRRSPALV
jgi:drug/metabolite transporter (DMT)-like permease